MLPSWSFIGGVVCKNCTNKCLSVWPGVNSCGDAAVHSCTVWCWILDWKGLQNERKGRKYESIVFTARPERSAHPSIPANGLCSVSHSQYSPLCDVAGSLLLLTAPIRFLAVSSTLYLRATFLHRAYAFLTRSSCSQRVQLFSDLTVISL